VTVREQLSDLTEHAEDGRLLDGTYVLVAGPPIR
jgi:hypothetical protein